MQTWTNYGVSVLKKQVLTEPRVRYKSKNNLSDGGGGATTSAGDLAVTSEVTRNAGELHAFRRWERLVTQNDWEEPYMLAKFYVSTTDVELARATDTR
jgi:hypothetical protein